MDNATIMALLFLGYVANILFFLAYGRKEIEEALKLHIFSMGLFVVSYVLFLSRLFIPEIVSAISGTFFSFAGLALEMFALVSMKEPVNRRLKRFLAAISLGGWAVFSVIALAGATTSQRIVVYSLVASLLVPYTAKTFLAKPRDSKMGVAIGILILLLFASLIARMLESLWSGKDMTIFSATKSQVAFYVVQFIYMLLSNTGIILFSKEKADQQLMLAATHDALTGALNRGAFENFAVSAISAYARNDTPYTVMLFDLDDFKRVNDTHGHHVGDLVLKDFAAAAAREIVSERDHFGRYGGDEFILIMRTVDEAAIQRIAERLRARSQGAAAGAFTYTVSTGATRVLSPKDRPLTLEEVTISCDRAMYEAKVSGAGRLAIRDL
ncbi:diguanylate cyclase [bacterium]|nr:diguanylate cyclase [bacterium]